MCICRNTVSFDRVRRDTGARPVWPAGALILFWGIYAEFYHRLCVWRCGEFFILIHVVFS